MDNHKYTWHKIAGSIAEINFCSNGLAEITVMGKTVCIARYNNTLRACAQKCPHAGGNLADGYLDPTGNIVCPLHQYKFSLSNGRNISGEGYFLKTYLLEERLDGIYIAINQNLVF